MSATSHDEFEVFCAHGLGSLSLWERAGGEQLSCLSRGPCMLGARHLLRLPRLQIPHHGFMMVNSVCMQAVSAPFLALPRGQQALVEGFDHRMVACGDERPPHRPHRADLGAAFVHGTPPAQRPLSWLKGRRRSRRPAAWGSACPTRAPGPASSAPARGRRPGCAATRPPWPATPDASDWCASGRHQALRFCVVSQADMGLDGLLDPGGAVSRRARAALTISTSWRRRTSRARSSWVLASGRGRGAGWTASKVRNDTRGNPVGFGQKRPFPPGQRRGCGGD